MFFDTIFFIQFAIYKGNKPKMAPLSKLEDYDTQPALGKGMLDHDTNIGHSHTGSE